MIIEASNRLSSVKEYYFSRKLREISRLNDQGKDIVNLGIGSPDLNPPDEVLDALKRHVHDVGIHKYAGYQGRLEFRQAICDHYKRYFGVHNLSQSSVLPLMGSKEGIMHISMAFLNESDEVLVPNPGYPSYAACAQLADAKPVYYDLDEKNSWLPQLDQISELASDRTKILWINYPNMPTGGQLDKSLCQGLVTLAKANDFLICHDNPYSFILNQYPFSPLSIDGAEDVMIELFSLSKSFNMAGWRLGALIGQSDYLNTCLRFKSNMDSGMFAALQLAGVQALSLKQDWFDANNRIYINRRKIVWKILDKLDCTYKKDASGLFVWARIPSNYSNGESLSEYILNTSNVFVTPGSIFGSNGDQFIRLSLCANTDRLEDALKRISKTAEK